MRRIQGKKTAPGQSCPALMDSKSLGLVNRIDRFQEFFRRMASLVAFEEKLRPDDALAVQDVCPGMRYAAQVVGTKLAAVHRLVTDAVSIDGLASLV